jgi:hypothetical protein
MAVGWVNGQADSLSRSGLIGGADLRDHPTAMIKISVNQRN